MVGGVRRHVRKPVEGPVRDDDDVGRRRKKKIEKREREKGGSFGSRENYRADYTALKSASSPLTGGLNFSPTWSSSWHRVRTTPPA